MVESKDQWTSSLLAMTRTPSRASTYLDDRLKFTNHLARQLMEGVGGCSRVVYGVWLDGHKKPIYIGQTADAHRRLWDLPIGESHHLSNSFPPEIWRRVVVVQWGHLFRELGDGCVPIFAGLRDMGVAEETKQLKVIGLGLEHLLQSRDRPLMNRRTKRRDGTWGQVNWSRSASLGARAAPFLGPLFGKVDEVWKALVSARPRRNGAARTMPGGLSVYPSMVRVRFSA